MIPAPRWRKVLRDLLRNPTRTVLVVLSIAVGVIAVAIVMGGYAVIAADLPGAFDATNPAHARLYAQPFNDDLVTVVRRMEGVADADARRTISVQARVADPDAGPGAIRWQPLMLFVIADFDDQRINIVRPQSGAWPPGKGEILIERASMEALAAVEGEPLTIKIGNDDERTLTVVGQAHDMNEIAADFTGQASGYMDGDTAEKLGLDRRYNELLIRVTGNAEDRAHNEAVAQMVADKVEKGGTEVFRTVVPRPGEHFLERFLTPMLLILGALGVLSLLLSSFLLVNIITALLTQQTRQIGVMKTVGASAAQLTRMYLASVTIFGALALALALPVGTVITNALTHYVARLMNFDIVTNRLTPPVVAMLVVVAVGVPVIAALGPILRGTRVTVREAINDFGAGSGDFGRSRFDRLLERIRGLSRPQLISLRNTFRRKGRLILTLATLILASAIFISVFSVRASLFRTMDDAFAYWNYEVRLDFARPYRADHLAAVALQVPGVRAAEAWGFRNVHRIRPDASQSDNIQLIAPQPNTALLVPTLLEGRWLLPTDENAVVINTDLRDDEPDLQVGDTIVLDIDGRERAWTIVGLVRSVMAGPYAYANYPYFAHMVRQVGQATILNVALDDRSPEAQAAMADELERVFEAQGVRVAATETTVAQREQVADQFGILISFLALMALLLAIVGGLGLSGTMSINVLERRREIGIMRSIGASTPAIMRIIVFEGVLIGAISWTLGALLALPLSRVLSDAVGEGFINSTLTWTYSLGGAGFWLLVMAGVAALASFVPARQAAGLTVREVLAYE
jgi:putative ABC transport system permease protein